MLPLNINTMLIKTAAPLPSPSPWRLALRSQMCPFKMHARALKPHAWPNGSGFASEGWKVLSTLLVRGLFPEHSLY